MVDRDLVASKLGELAEHVARVRTRRAATAEDLRRDRDALDLVAFNLMLAVHACADVASHVIADEGWPPAVPTGSDAECPIRGAYVKFSDAPSRTAGAPPPRYTPFMLPTLPPTT